MKYSLGYGGVRFEYEIKSDDIQPIPYGIALHPYFTKLDGEDDTFLCAPFDSTYDNIEEDLIPTGKLSAPGGKVCGDIFYKLSFTHIG